MDIIWRREAEGQGTYDEGGVEGVGWIIIKDEIARMENVEHNTTIENNVMNEYGQSSK